MARDKVILGHIDCPTCGTAKGMRITHDKNGDPFGYCEAECGQQLRVGGDKRRVRQFVARYPFAGAVTGTDTEAKPAPTPAPVPEDKPAPTPTKPRSPFEDALKMLGGR